ncbi:MAG: phosphoserine transaminase [Trueperella sp.]|nr:phosphoserine transaminase [Trueperella sp.]
MATLPENLHPSDGRFGSGPSKVRPAQLAAINADSPMGTSHRQEPVRALVREIQDTLAQLFQLPAGYEVLVGNGGASALWDAISFTLIRERSQCAVSGEFSGKMARAAQRAPWLADPEIVKVPVGEAAQCVPSSGIDAYCYAHNETSTGVAVPVQRIGDDAALTIVDGTSIAGGAVFDASAVDFYYFSPQKCFGADGGLWFAFASPAALDRIAELSESRWVPDFLNLQLAVNNSRKNQTLNTPAIGTLLLMREQVRWMTELGGLRATAARSSRSSSAVYQWAEARADAEAFVRDPAFRSPVVATVDFTPEVDTKAISAQLRAEGIVDIDPYRSLGRNQFRIGTFPAVEPEDVTTLLAAIDHLIG